MAAPRARLRLGGGGQGRGPGAEMLGFYASSVSILGFAPSSTLKVGKILQNKTRQRAVKPASLRRRQLWPWLTQLLQNEGRLGHPSLYRGCLLAVPSSLPHVCFCTSHNQSLIASITSQLPAGGVRSLPDILRRKLELEAGVVAPSTVSSGGKRHLQVRGQLSHTMSSRLAKATCCALMSGLGLLSSGSGIEASAMSPTPCEPRAACLSCQATCFKMSLKRS